MKKYNEFIIEKYEDAQDVQYTQVQDGDQEKATDEVNVESKFKEFYDSARKFILNNIITSRGLDFHKDTDEILLKKSKQQKYKDYWTKINKIIEERKIQSTKKEAQPKAQVNKQISTSQTTTTTPTQTSTQTTTQVQTSK